MNKLPLFAATTLLTLAFPALSVASVKCQSGTPEGEYACLAPDLKLVEGQVDRQLQQLAAKLRENARTKNTSAINRLNASQRIWRDYRSSFCAVENPLKPRSTIIAVTPLCPSDGSTLT